MTTITIQLPDEAVRNLEITAAAQNKTIESVAASTIVEAISRQTGQSQAERLSPMMDKIVGENTELYKRLA